MKLRSFAIESSTRKRYSSAYPLSGLIICGKCNGTYNRVTWQNKSGKSFVWRCRERLKAGTVQCKQSATIRESGMLKLVSELFNTIVKTDPAESSVYLIKTKAVLRVNLDDKEEFDENELTKQLLSKVIDRIVVKDEKTAVVHFRSGLIIEKTLS